MAKDNGTHEKGAKSRMSTTVAVNRLVRWGTFDGRQRLTNKLSTGCRRHSPRNRRFYMTGCCLTDEYACRGTCQRDSSAPLRSSSFISVSRQFFRPAGKGDSISLLLKTFLICIYMCVCVCYPLFVYAFDLRNIIIMYRIIEFRSGRYIGDCCTAANVLLTINYGIFLTAGSIAIFRDVGNRPGYNSLDKF